MNDKQRRRAIRRLILKHDDGLYQFGDPSHQKTTNNGNYTSTGCTQAVLVFLILVWRGILVTVDDVSRIAGYTLQQKQADEGLTGAQVALVFAHFGLPYDVVVNPTRTLLQDRIDNRGPVMMAVGYDYYPEWMGYKYRGTVADGYPNGYAHPFQQAGRNQLTHAGFGHAVAAFGHRSRPDIRIGLERFWLHDPNHKSDARPEASPVDVVTGEQLMSMLRRFPHFSKHTNSTVVWAPNRPWEGAE